MNLHVSKKHVSVRGYSCHERSFYLSSKAWEKVSHAMIHRETATSLLRDWSLYCMEGLGAMSQIFSCSHGFRFCQMQASLASHFQRRLSHMHSMISGPALTRLADKYPGHLIRSYRSYRPPTNSYPQQLG